MNGSCSAYLVLRCILGALDVCSDILFCVYLALDDQLLWSLAVGGWVVLALLLSILAVIVERCRRGVPLSTCKYLLMTFKIHAEIGEAFLESGPQLVTQLMILWAGIHQHDFQVSLCLAWFVMMLSFFTDLYRAPLPGGWMGLAAGGKPVPLLRISECNSSAV